MINWAYSYTLVQNVFPLRVAAIVLPLRVAAIVLPLRVAAIVLPLRVAAIVLPLRVAAARNRSDWFPAPSSGQALRPAPVMHVGGLLIAHGHASAAINR
jgi:hypothetical protein